MNEDLKDVYCYLLQLDTTVKEMIKEARRTFGISANDKNAWRPWAYSYIITRMVK